VIVTRALSIALAGALLLAGWQTLRLSGEQSDHADTRARHAEQMQAMFEAARQAGEQARTEERRRTAEVQKAADEAHQALERARADAAAATDAGQRLRDRLASLTATCGRASGDAGPAVSGPSAVATADLLADVQRRLDEAADGIARHADAARAAGLACQRSYDALTR
jgi:hypothetical protein